MTYNNLTHAYYVSQEKKTNKFPSNYLYQPIAYSYHFNESMKSIQMIIPRVTVAPDLKKTINHSTRNHEDERSSKQWIFPISETLLDAAP